MEFRSKMKKFIKRKWGDLCRRSHYVLMGLPFVLVTSGIVLSAASVIRIHQAPSPKSPLCWLWDTRWTNCATTLLATRPHALNPCWITLS